MKFMDKKTFLILAFLFALLSISIFGSSYKLEGFANLQPGTYPISVDVPLLHEYPLKKIWVCQIIHMLKILRIIPYLDLLMDNSPIMFAIGKHQIMVNVHPPNFVEDYMMIKK